MSKYKILINDEVVLECDSVDIATMAFQKELERTMTKDTAIISIEFHLLEDNKYVKITREIGNLPKTPV